MNPTSTNFKLLLVGTYLTIIAVGLYFLFTFIDFKDLTSYELIRTNKDVILKYKNENFLFLTCAFFIFSIIWTLLLGFAMPLLVFSGFVFGKWWGIIIVLTSTTIGATLLYVMAGFFFRDIIEKKLAPKFSKLKEFFIKNDILYFMSYSFIGGGGTPYAIQNIIDENEKPSLIGVATSSEIYLPIIGFFIIFSIAFFIKKIYFKS